MEIEKINLLKTDECEAFIKEANDLRNMVKLEEDPISSLGFLGINKQLANLQSAKERITDLLLKSITNKSNAQRLVSNAKGSYGIAYSTAMTTDPEVISQTSKEKREAAAAVKVQEDYRLLQQAEDSLACSRQRFQRAIRPLPESQQRPFRAGGAVPGSHTDFRLRLYHRRQNSAYLPARGGHRPPHRRFHFRKGALRGASKERS